MGLNPGDRNLPNTADRRGGAANNDQAIDDGERGGSHDGDTDCESQFSDLPSLQDIFAWTDKDSRGRDGLSHMTSVSPDVVDGAGKEGGHEGGGKDMSDLPSTATTDVQLGATAGTPIVLSDGQSINTHVAPVTLNSLDNPARYTRDDDLGGRKEGSNPYVHNTNTYTLARSESVDKRRGSGIASNTPTSVGQIHDIFAEYEETFGIPRRKQQTVRVTPPSCLDDNATAGSTPPFVSQGESREVTDDGIVATHQATAAEGSDTGWGHFSSKGVESGPPSQSVRKINWEGAGTEGIESQYILTLADSCYLAVDATTSHAPSTPRGGNEARRLDFGNVIQEAPDRKRAWPSTQPTGVPDFDNSRKRPRRARKETWKAREAREAKQAAVGLQALDSRRKTRTLSIGPSCARGKVDYRVAHIEDVFLAEDGSIQCLVTWKSSLVAMEKVAGGKLRQRCEQLFREKYG